MDTLSDGQRLLDENVALRRHNEKLMAENARLRRELHRARQQLVRPKIFAAAHNLNLNQSATDSRNRPKLPLG